MIRVDKKNHVHKMSINNKPCITVQPGTRLVMETWDSLEGRSEEYFYNKTPHSEIFTCANPATGPVFVEGAHPGDALEVEIHDIRLQGEGYIVFARDYFTGSSGNEEYIYKRVVIKDDQLFYNGRGLPVKSMVGVIGTAPLQEMWCQETGDHGGNMDAKAIAKGSKVLLPVYTEGALLAIGDVHAAMGDGEVFGQGIEVGADIEIAVKVIKNSEIIRPMVLNDDSISCIASNTDILVAQELAVADMGNYLVGSLGFEYEDACALLAFYGDLHFCQVVNPQKTVRLEVRKEYIDLFKTQI